MNKTICLIASTMLILSTSGCATNRCGNGLFGGGLFSGQLMKGGLFQNGPLSDGPIRSFFRGAPCSTCNPPSGQMNGFGGNVAPLCNDGNCGSGTPVSAPANIQLNAPGVPYYDSGNVASPTPAIQNYGASVVPQGSVVPNATVQGSSNRVTYGGMEDLPTIDAFSSSIDADAIPPTP